MRSLKYNTFRRALQLLPFLFFLQFPGLCNAWYTPMHMDIVRTAFEHLPASVREVFAPYLDAVLWGSLAPDLILRDWENHEWNIHRAPGDSTGAPAGIEQIFQETLHDLEEESLDLAEAAYKIGLLSHYLADINQPLHTDDYANDNNWIHFAYESDVYEHRAELAFSSLGLRLRSDIYSDVISSAQQANLYYQTIIDAYEGEKGYEGVNHLTTLNYQRAVSDIVDVWMTLWMQASSKEPVIALRINQLVFQPGDTVQLRLTAIPGSLPARKADLYVAVLESGGGLWYMGPDERLSRDLAPFRRSWTVSQHSENTLFSAAVEGCDTTADFRVYALLVSTDDEPSDPGSWMSNLAEIQVRVEPLPGVYENGWLGPGLTDGKAVIN